MNVSVEIMKYNLRKLVESADAMADFICAEYPYTPSVVSEYSANLKSFEKSVRDYNKERKEANRKSYFDRDLADHIEDEIRAESIELSNLEVD